MIIIIGKKKGIITDATFERILNAADCNFRKMQALEGKMFPESDKKAQSLIRDFQWWLSEKTLGKTEDAG